jgi:acetylglutamate kinase
LKPETIVIKYGGAAMKDDTLKKAVLDDIAELSKSNRGHTPPGNVSINLSNRGHSPQGCVPNTLGNTPTIQEYRIVLVHGGGPELSALQERLGLETKFVDGLRYTDEATMEAALMALAGKVNKTLAAELNARGCKAVGISGIDAGLITCTKLETQDLGFVGEVKSIDATILETLLNSGNIPVVATLGQDTNGVVYTVNADTVAGEIADALGADRYIVMSDIPGVLKDENDEASLINELRISEIEPLIEEGVITGGMIPKIRSCAALASRGVGSVSIIDGRKPGALRLELQDKEKTGTTIVNDGKSEW